MSIRRTAPKTISVVIAAYNTRHVIDTQLSALAAQDYSGRFEVIVSDNGSTDGLREHLDAHDLRNALDLQWVDSSDARGVSHARNVGVAASHGDFLAFCDADDKVGEAWLRTFAEAAETFDVVGGGLDGSTLSSPRAVSWRPLTEVATQPTSANARFPWVGGGNIGLWRDAFDAAGGWDENYRYALEDMALCWQLQLRGFTLGWRPEAVVSYRLRDDLGALRRQAFQYGRGEVQLYREFRDSCMRRRPVPYLVLLLFLIVVRNPLLPRMLTRLPRGQWLWHVWSLAGRVRGSAEYRVWYV